jgi:hypothetical protein
MSYAEVFEAFPSELQLPIARLVDVLRAEFEVPRADFTDLKAAMQSLAEAQARTEMRIEELGIAQTRTEARMEELATAQTRTEARMEELATAQARTEARMEELATAQARTEARMEELVTAQARTETRMEELATAQSRTEMRVGELGIAQTRAEARLDRLTVAVEELAQAQKHTEHELTALAQAQGRTQEEVTLFRRTFMSQIGGLGARWGLQTEEAFRHGIRTILGEVGFTVERFLTWDATGEAFGHPEQVELDVVIRNGKAIVVEIKSSLDRANTYLFDRKVAFYTRHTGRQVDRKVVIASYADERAKEVAMRLGIEVCTDVTEFR